MSRAAVYELFKDDAVLGAEPFSIGEKVYPSFTLRGSRKPPADSFFLILRWEETLDTVGSIEVLTVWSHRSRSAGVDFEKHRDILNRCRTLLEGSIHLAGTDGKIMTQAKFKGMGPDNMDEGYDTTTKYAVFEINSKVGAA
jgi:hypothetical protein